MAEIREKHFSCFRLISLGFPIAYYDLSTYRMLSLSLSCSLSLDIYISVSNFIKKTI